MAEPKTGPTKRVPLYLDITEGRGINPSYGWCGDAVTWSLMHAGVRDGSILNRTELNGHWQPGDNLSRIYRWAQASGSIIERSRFDEVQPGDLILVEAPQGGHIGMFIKWIQVGVGFMSADGNTWMHESGTRARDMRVQSGTAGHIQLAISVEKMPLSQITVPDPAFASQFVDNGMNADSLLGDNPNGETDLASLL
jgi:hypothetical protein